VNVVPNGYHGTEEGWRRLEAPLKEIDAVLEAFAAGHELNVSRNSRGDPERSLWNDGHVRRLIQIFVGDEKAPTYKVWLCASQDRGRERYWKRRFITEAATSTELKSSIGEWLSEGYAELFGWSEDDLVFATRLATPR
jgi:hypothetical protein